MDSKQQPQQIPISKAGAVMLNTVKDELFPQIRKARDLLVRVQNIRTTFLTQLYCRELSLIEHEYGILSRDFFEVVRKLQTPDILFSSLENKEDPNNVADYFRFGPAIEKNIMEGVTCLEIIDRTIDRKSQKIQNTRTLIVSLLAILLSLIALK